MKFKRISLIFLAFLMAVCCMLSSCESMKGDSSDGGDSPSVKQTTEDLSQKASFALSDIPEFTTEPFVVINNNIPEFTDEELTTESFEKYSSLDRYGRCGVAFACIGLDLMPTEDRGNISSVKPSGWQSVQYDIVDGKYLYNRCHLIGFQLSGENANKQNLITGTRYFNVEGMLPFENMVADYVKETENHVMFRVTPIYEGDELVARGVHMEAYSVEDEGEGVCFSVYVYNAHPGITIDYATGKSHLNGETPETETDEPVGADPEGVYVLNTNTKKFHYPSCSSASSMSPLNRQEYNGSRDILIAQGYAPCGICDP